MMDVNDELGIERLARAVYDGVLIPGEMPQLSGQHAMSCIITGMFSLIYKETRVVNTAPSHAPLHHSSHTGIQKGQNSCPLVYGASNS